MDSFVTSCFLLRNGKVGKLRTKSFMFIVPASIYIYIYIYIYIITKSFTSSQCHKIGSEFRDAIEMGFAAIHTLKIKGNIIIMC
jgi:hypothetical protein